MKKKVTEKGWMHKDKKEREFNKCLLKNNKLFKRRKKIMYKISIKSLNHVCDKNTYKGIKIDNISFKKEKKLRIIRDNKSENNVLNLKISNTI